jgi:hypothetical protein
MRSAFRLLGLCLVALAFAAAPAFANNVDVTDTSGFGTSILTTSSTFSNGFNFNVDVTTTVFFNSSTGVYTYVYTLSNYTGGNPVDIFSIGSLNFNSSLNWGTVTGSTSSGVGLDNPDATTFGQPTPFCSSNGFLGCSSSTLTFFFSNGTGTSGGLHTGETITIYAQAFSGPGPSQHSAIAIDSDFATGTVPAPVPEPGTMALFGSGMIGLAFALRRKLLG